MPHMFFPIRKNLETNKQTNKNRRRRTGRRGRAAPCLVPRLRRRLGRPPRPASARVPVPGRGAGRDEHQDGADADGVENREKGEGERGQREREEGERFATQKRNKKIIRCFQLYCFLFQTKTNRGENSINKRMRARCVWCGSGGNGKNKTRRNADFLISFFSFLLSRQLSLLKTAPPPSSSAASSTRAVS